MTKHEILTQQIALGFTKRHRTEQRKEAQHQELAARRAFNLKVRQLTEQQPLDQVPGIALRGAEYHLDHAVSIAAAWKAGWTPEQCADVSNLQVLPRAENMRKRDSCYCNLTLSLNLTSRLTAN